MKKPKRKTMVATLWVNNPRGLSGVLAKETVGFKAMRKGNFRDIAWDLARHRYAEGMMKRYLRVTWEEARKTR